MLSKLLERSLEGFRPFLESGANEVVINEPQRVWLDRGGEWEAVEAPPFTLQFLNNFCIELANAREMRFDEEHPYLSCEIPAQSKKYRVQATHKIALHGSPISITIRIPSQKVFRLEDFSITDEDWDYERLKNIVTERKNILVSGGTGSGKTSLLNALIHFIDPNDRVVTIEDSQELLIKNENRVHLLVDKLETKAINYQNALNSTMRMRPDRLLLGEIDTRNTLSFLRLSNTGHAGMISTIHANSSKDALNAIITNSMFQYTIAESAITKLMKSALDFIIQIQRIKNERVISCVLDLKSFDEI